MKLKKLIERLEPVSTNADPEMEITGVCYDSRKVTAGNAFVAVKGFESDGHRFISKAVENGAAVIICEDAPEQDVPYVQLTDTRRGLALVSAAYFGYPAEKMKIIGVTGTSGKTTSTHLIKHIIEQTTGAMVGLVGTNGNAIGQRHIHSEHTTPESYDLQELFSEMAEAGCEYAVMEVSSHALALERVAGISFACAAYTNLALDHLDFHNTMDEYAAAKKKLFSMCNTACINIDDERGPYMIEGEECRIIKTSALDSTADIFARDIKLSAQGVEFTAVCGNKKTDVTLAIPGMFSVYNALTAISACSAVGIDIGEAAAALATAVGVKGRVETVPTDGDYSIIIDYSHKPDSLIKVLKTLRAVTRGRLICLFGCGGDRDRTKRPIMGKAAADFSDVVIVTSDNPRTEDPQAIIDEILPGVEGTDKPVITICDRIEAIHWAIDNAQPGDVILLAGKGHEDYQIIGHEKHHMDEREIVADYLKEKRL